MTPVHQSIKHNPEAGLFGDCHRAAIATVLDLPLDAVPHFLFDGCSGEEFARREAVFLGHYGLFPALIPYSVSDGDYQVLLSTIGNLNGRDFVYLLAGTSRTGCNHTVVCRGSAIVHDPSPISTGIVGPCDDGLFWLTVFCDLRISKQSVAARYPQPNRQSA